MSFYVNLYTFTKEPNSTAQPTGAGTQYQCISNQPFDVLHPSIPLNLGNAANPTAYNYCKIPDFQNRYYWIRTWTWEDGLWVAHCDVDPLASWKTSIGSTNAYVLRAAAEWDGTIIDNMWPQKTVVKAYEKDQGAAQWSELPRGGSYVVGIAGSGATTYYWFTFLMLDVFLKYLYSNDYANNALSELALTVNPELKAQLNPLQYITSIVWLPYDIATANNIVPTAASELWVGYVNVIGKTYQTATVSAYELGGLIGSTFFSETWTLKRHPDAATLGIWVNSSLAEISVNIPPFGNIHLDPMQIANNDVLTAGIMVDARTGYAILNIWVGPAAAPLTNLISRVTGQVGMPFQIGQVMAPGTGMASLLPSIVSGASAVAAGIATGGAAGVAIGAAGVASAGVSAIGTIAQNKIPHPNTVGGTPSVAANSGPRYMFYTWYTLGDMDVTHRGRPLCQIKRLDTLPGYQLCANTDVQAAATREELDAIRGFLESGYYYE
jgi:hypothetical protein